MSEEKEYRFAKSEDGETNLADEPRLALLAKCIADQQRAGFKEYLDLRQCDCPDCGAPGFNTGWGAWEFACGAEILSDGTPAEDCPNPSPRP